MWMSHGDKVTAMPTGFVKVAHTDNSEHAAIANLELQMFGLQFHPEVTPLIPHSVTRLDSTQLSPTNPTLTCHNVTR